MKLLNMICIAFGAVGAFRIPKVGLSAESYLDLARKHSYQRLMKNLSLGSRRALIQTIKNEKSAKFRAALAKAMMEESKIQVSRKNAAEKQIKSRGRMNRFKNFHN